MRTPRLRDIPAWRAMFKRSRAKDAARRRAEADRWRGLSPAEQWAEMARYAGRWRCLLDDRVRSRMVEAFKDPGQLL